MTIRQTELQLDLGTATQEALRYQRNHPTVTLGAFLRLYPARSRQPVPADFLPQPLQHFLLVPITLKQGSGVAVESAGPPTGALRRQLDELYAADVAATSEPESYPERLSDSEAVRIAYRHELQAIARFLRNDLSVLILCDKILTEHLYEYVCQQAGKQPMLDDALPDRRPANQQEALARAMQGGGGGADEKLRLAMRTLKEGQVLVLRSVEILDAPPLIEMLYQGGSSNRMPQLLGFLDPSLEVRKVLTDRFAIRVAITGLPRYIQPDRERPPLYTVTRLITAHERQCFQTLDAEGLYKNVAGLNAIQFRNAMRYVGAEVAPNSGTRAIYDVIRHFKSSSSNEIEIPDTSFNDIGGYDGVKRELQRIVALLTGRVPGIDERERQRLIPRGFIFHGPPGTGKTLFAKAIANEMNATIQMISGPEIMDKYVGQSESNLRHIFTTARRNAPSVIFFDEFDSLASQRSTYTDGGARANNAVVAQLLTELDGFREDQAVLVIGTSNRIDIIDEALLRPSRLRPIEIGLPDYVARRSVTRIHATKFGVDGLLRDLYALALDHLAAWEQSGALPPTLLQTLFAQHPAYAARHQTETAQSALLREVQQVFTLVQKVQQATGPRAIGAGADPLGEVEEELLQLARSHGFNLLDSQNTAGTSADALRSSLAGELHKLYTIIRAPGQAQPTTPPAFVEGILDLIAEYTDGFNNDEIRAIFQEASLEHHMEGRLITPAFLGMKIGLIRKRRDERQVVHLVGVRGRR